MNEIEEPRFTQYDADQAEQDEWFASLTDEQRIANGYERIHEPTMRNGLFSGYWVTCACKWSGPSFHNRQLATRAYEKHLREVQC